MSDCLNHKKEVAGISDMKVLSEMIGDLHYESLTILLGNLTSKLYNDGIKYISNDKEEIGKILLQSGQCMALAHNKILKVWKICKPFMQEK